jgi:hypothetical protein
VWFVKKEGVCVTKPVLKTGIKIKEALNPSSMMGLHPQSEERFSLCLQNQWL